MSFHLASVFDQKFVLPKKHEASAVEALRTHARTGQGELWEAIARATTFDQCLAACDCSALRDTRNKIIGLQQGADVWAWDLLPPIAHLVEGAYFLLEDDRGLFFRVAVEDGSVRHYEQVVSSRWRADAHANRELLAKMLSPTGWLLDEQAMARQKADIEQFWGADARKDVDEEVPMTRYSRSGTHFASAIEYWSSTSPLAIHLNWVEPKSSDMLTLVIPAPYGIEPIIAAAIERQDVVSADNWRKHVAELQKRFKGIRIASESGRFNVRS